jgi:hypothetical protein
MAIQDRDRRPRIGFGVANVVVGLAVLGGVFRLLPTRWWVVDVPALLIGGLMLASGVTLLRSLPPAEKITRWAALIVLVLGMAVVTALFATAGWISGVYGSVGAGGAIIFTLVATLVLPYLVVLPAAELAWLGPPLPKKESEPKPADA